MKKTNWMMAALLALALTAVGLGGAGCNKSEPVTSDNKPETTASDKAAVKYTCNMHPEVVKDAPGNCPKCGMKLVEKR